MERFQPRIYTTKPWLIRLLIPEYKKGTYVLYRKIGNQTFPFYIGRSDRNLRNRLITHPYLKYAHYFEYYLFDSKEKCFISESSLYHNLQDMLLNKIHPATPEYSSLTCPFCYNSFNNIRMNRINEFPNQVETA